MLSPAWDGDQRVTQGFGGNAAAYARFGLAGHNGIDIGCWTGTEIYAPEDCYVLEVTSDPLGYGLTVYLMAASNYGWRYGHMSRIDVRQGIDIPRGSLLGLSGNTGNSSGPHLHIGVRPPNADRGNGYGGYIDPTPRLIELQDEPQEDPAMIAALEAQVAEISADRDKYIEANAYNERKALQFESLLREPAYRKVKTRYRQITQVDIDAAVARAQQ